MSRCEQRAQRTAKAKATMRVVPVAELMKKRAKLGPLKHLEYDGDDPIEYLNDLVDQTRG
jgi:hypothetical protein